MRFSARRIGLLGLCLASSVLGGWLALRGVDPARLAGQASNAQPSWLAAAVAVFGVAIAVRAVRWWVLFPAPRPSLTGTTLATLVGYFFNSILPARAGEGARLVALRRTSEVPSGRIAGTIVSERILDTAVLAALFTVASPLTTRQIFSPAVELGVAAAVGAITAALVGLAYVSQTRPARLDAATGRLPASLAPHVAGVVDGLTAWRRQGAAATAAAIGLTALSWVLLGVSNYLLLQGFDLRVPFAAGLIVALATGLAMILPSAPASLGVFEATTVLCLRGYPVSHLQAVSYAVALHAVNVIPLLIVGALATMYVARSPRLRGAAGGAGPEAAAVVSVQRVRAAASGADLAQELHSAGR